MQKFKNRKEGEAYKLRRINSSKEFCNYRGNDVEICTCVVITPTGIEVGGDEKECEHYKSHSKKCEDYGKEGCLVKKK